MTNVILHKWLDLVDYCVTEGFENMWFSYGELPYQLEHGPQGFVPHDEEIATHVVFDRATNTVQELFVFDGARNRPYRWMNPAIRDAYKAECAKRQFADVFCDDTNYIDLETPEDFFEKASAILEGREYDDRIDVPVDLDDDTFIKLARAAHERDITINEMVEICLRQLIDEHRGKAEF